jgi:hypothetical protein
VIQSGNVGTAGNSATLFRIAEQAGHFEDPQPSINGITRIIVDTEFPRSEALIPLPNSVLNRDQR